MDRILEQEIENYVNRELKDFGGMKGLESAIKNYVDRLVKEMGEVKDDGPCIDNTTMMFPCIEISGKLSSIDDNGHEVV